MKITQEYFNTYQNNDNGYTPTQAPVLDYYSDVFSPWQTKEKLKIGRETTDIIWLWWASLTSTLTFTSTSNTNVSWSNGQVFTTDNSTYTITSWSTGVMSSVTYIYLDTILSKTTLQTTTLASNSVWNNKFLICVAWPVVWATKKAEFQAFGSKDQSTFITADNIAANTITGNEIVWNTITTNEIQAWAITTNELNFIPLQSNWAANDINTYSTTINWNKITTWTVIANVTIRQSVASDSIELTNVSNIPTLKFVDNWVAVCNLQWVTGKFISIWWHNFNINTLSANQNIWSAQSIISNQNLYSNWWLYVWWTTELHWNNIIYWATTFSWSSSLNMWGKQISNMWTIHNWYVSWSPLVVTWSYISLTWNYVALTSWWLATYELWWYTSSVNWTSKIWLTE